MGLSVPLESQFKLIAGAMPAARSVGLLYRGKTGKSAELPWPALHRMAWRDQG